MSNEKLEAFAQAVSKNEELQKRFVSIQAETARSTAEKMADLSKSAGTPFTVDEYLHAIVESSDEMSEQQLRGVAGGVWEPSADNIMASIFTAGTFCAVRALTSAVELLNPDSCQWGRR